MLGFDRITFDPHVMGGRACIRGIRITVSLLVNLVANGMTSAEILDAYPYLEPEDIHQALHYVAWLAEETVHPLEPVQPWNFWPIWAFPPRPWRSSTRWGMMRCICLSRGWSGYQTQALWKRPARRGVFC
jgi:uncharacterized protein (DUF433 family)